MQKHQFFDFPRKSTFNNFLEDTQFALIKKIYKNNLWCNRKTLLATEILLVPRLNAKPTLQSPEIYIPKTQETNFV